MYQFEPYVKRFPRQLVRLVRDAYLLGLDLKDRLTGESDDLVPPRSIHYVGGGDFETIGNKFVQHFINQCGLKNDEAVLDLGCGTGRMAIPLLGYLGPAGSYVGFDISKKAIAWCQRSITARNPRFTFHFADICNTEYNPGGAVSATDYRFPATDGSVDFAFATSVFTHMRRVEVRSYLKELSRTLRRGGRAMITFFILEKENELLMRQGQAILSFAHVLDDECLTIDPKTPERAIAYRQEDLQAMVAGAGLELLSPILFGSWSGRASMLESQDVVIVGKPA